MSSSPAERRNPASLKGTRPAHAHSCVLMSVVSCNLCMHMIESGDGARYFKKKRKRAARAREKERERERGCKNECAEMQHKVGERRIGFAGMRIRWKGKVWVRWEVA